MLKTMIEVEISGRKYKVFEGATRRDCAVIAILLSAINLSKSLECELYWGSELNVDIGNAAAIIASEALGIDICEDEEWVYRCCKATDTEISTYVIQYLLASIKDEVPVAATKIFSVAFNAGTVGFLNLSRIIERPNIAQIWTDAEEITDDSGWESKYLIKARELKVGQCIRAFNFKAHTVFRIA